MTVHAIVLASCLQSPYISATHYIIAFYCSLEIKIMPKLLSRVDSSTSILGVSERRGGGCHWENLSVIILLFISYF